MSLDVVKLKHLRFILSCILLVSVYGTELKAQINAPEFLCVQNDTLRWNVPVNTCGTFNAYLIHSSQSAAGPYSVLARITDPAQRAYFHDGAGNQTWFYYLESELDCPGQPILKSDTLNNRIPDAGPIRVVTVEDSGTVRIDWMLSPSPQVIGYIISRQNALGTTILDTVYNGLTYMDAAANPGVQSETYFVVALDPCSNLSLVPDPHQTIFMEMGTLDSCTLQIPLQWSPYINWPNGVDRYEILASVKSPAGNTPGPFEVAGAVDGNTTRFDFSADDGRQYCIKIRAVAAGSTDVSLSNESCIEIGIIEIAQDLLIHGLQVNPFEDLPVLDKGGVQVRWKILPQVFLPQMTLLRSDGVDLQPVGDIDGNLLEYNDNDADAFQGPLTYQLISRDFCNNELISNTMTTAFLTGRTENGENILQWTPYQNDLFSNLSYIVYRYNPNDPQQQSEAIATYPGTVFTHVDPIDLRNPEQQSFCYYLAADTQINVNGNLTGTTNITVSNSVCLTQSSQLFVPNAFVPNGVNREFKPVLQFGGSEEYLMTIYDRYGGVIFESQDISTGWDGSKNGRPLPQGMYVYLIKMQQSSGTMIEKKGTVLLLR